RYAPTRRFYISGIDGFFQQPRHRHGAQRAVFSVFGEIRVTLKKTLHFRLRHEPARCVTFESLPYGRGYRFVQNQHLAAARWRTGIAVAHGRTKYPIAAFDAGLHLLHDLTAVLFSLQLALSRNN